MADLKINIIVDDAGAVQKLQQVEDATKRVERTAETSATAISGGSAKIVQAHEAQGVSAVKAASAYERLSVSVRNFASMAGAMFAGNLLFSIVNGLQDMARESMRAASTLVDMSAKTGLSIEVLQRMAFVGKQTGVSIEQFANASFMLGVNISKGSERVRAAVADITNLGVSYDQLRSMSPDQQFETIAGALGKMASEQDRNRIGAELFGRSFKTIAPSIAADYARIADAASVASAAEIRALDDLGDAWDAFVANMKTRTTQVLGSMVLMAEGAKKLGFLQTSALFLTQGYAVGSATLAGMGSAGAGGHDINLPNPNAAKPLPLDPEANAKIAEHAREVQRAREEWQKFNDEITGKTAIKSAQDWMKHLDQVGGITKLTDKATKDLTNSLGDAIEAYGRLGQVAPAAMMRTWIATISPTASPLTQIPGRSLDVASQMALPQLPLPQMVGATSGLGGLQLPGALNVSQQMALPNAPSFLSSIFGGSSGFGAGIAQSIMGAIQGGGNVLEAGGSFIGSKLGSGLGKLLSTSLPGVLGSAFNAVLPGVGAMLGPLLGKIGGYFKNLFGNQVKELINKSFGSYDELHAKLQSLGATGEQMWIKLTQHTGKNDLLSAKTQIEAINTALAKYKTISDQILEAGRTDWQKIDEAAKRYGIDIATLGGTFQAQRMHEGWQQIVDDLDLFDRGGADMAQILTGMGPKISELVQQSIAFGTVIPENMRPWIEKLISSHQLLDASGKEITDISTMTFGETMQTTLANLNQTLKDLITTLGGVPSAAQTAVGGWNSAWSGAAKPPYVSEGGSPDESAPQQEAPPYHTGGLLRIAHRGGLGPDEFPIIAQSGEYMMRRSAVQQYGRSFMSAVNNGSYTPRGGGGGTAIIQLDGRTVGEIVVPHIPGIVKRFRVGTR